MPGGNGAGAREAVSQASGAEQWWAGAVVEWAWSIAGCGAWWERRGRGEDAKRLLFGERPPGGVCINVRVVVAPGLVCLGINHRGRRKHFHNVRRFPIVKSSRYKKWGSPILSFGFPDLKKKC